MVGHDRTANSSAPSSDTGIVSRLEWHRPAIIRIDIKRTLFGTGSHTDGSTFDPGSSV
jgi:hypothetical protein